MPWLRCRPSTRSRKPGGVERRVRLPTPSRWTFAPSGSPTQEAQRRKPWGRRVVRRSGLQLRPVRLRANHAGRGVWWRFAPRLTALGLDERTREDQVRPVEAAVKEDGEPTKKPAGGIEVGSAISCSTGRRAAKKSGRGPRMAAAARRKWRRGESNPCPVMFQRERLRVYPVNLSLVCASPADRVRHGPARNFFSPGRIRR